MEVGSIYSHENFRFDNGNVVKKLLIVLSTANKERKTNFLVCVTTSKDHPKSYRTTHKDPGCYGGGETERQQHYYFFKVHANVFFNVDTWVMFDKVWEFTEENFLKDASGVPATKVGALTIEQTNAVLNCVLKSYDIMNRHALQIKTDRKEAAKPKSVK